VSDDFPEVRATLDSLPAPLVPPVDLAAIYRAAHERQVRVARRWKRAAGGIAALAAGVFLLALVPKLDVRLSRDEFAVRWGQPPAAREAPPTPAFIPQPDPRLPSLIEEQQKQVAALRAANLKHAELQDLLLTLTTDVADRDQVQLARIVELTRELRAFQLATARQFEQTEQTNTTLYNVLFTTKPKPGG